MRVQMRRFKSISQLIFKLPMSSPKKPSFLKKCNEVFLKMDLFSNCEYLKYNGEGSYQTYTGSTLSVILVVFFVVIFYSFCKQTLNREKITNTPRLRPSLGTSFNTNESNSPFIFAMGIDGIDLNAGERLFDIFMANKVYKNGKLFSSEEVAMKPCLLEQWENFNDQFKKIFARLNFQEWVCPPKNNNFTFKGKPTSEEYQYTQLVVRRCSPAVAKCASFEKFTAALLKQQAFKLSVYFANPVIDASEKNYLDYVLEDTTYFEFTDMVGVSSHIFFSEYEVNTDNSIYPEPYSDVVTERGLTLNERPVVSNFEIINSDEFARISLRKADLIQQFDRSYTRFDATFSYLGGLFGMVLLLFYGIKAFSEYAYEFEIGSHLFVYKDKERSEFDSDRFHILRFPIYLLYCIVTFFYPHAETWSCFTFQRSVDECRDEVKEQTDVCFLIKRIIYIEKAIELFCSAKLDQINLDHRWSIDEAREKREFYNNHKRVRNLVITSERKAAEDLRERTLAKAASAQAKPDLVENNNELGKVLYPTVKIREESSSSPPKSDEDVIVILDGEEIEIEVEMEREIIHEQLSSRNDFGPHRQLGSENRINTGRKELVKYSQERVKAQSSSKRGSSEGLNELLQNKENVQISPFHFNTAGNNKKDKQSLKKQKDRD